MSDECGGRWWDALPRPQWAKLKKIEQSQDWFEVYCVAPGVFTGMNIPDSPAMEAFYETG